MELDFDYHNHTALSRCSRKDYTVAEMLARMQDIGLKHVGFCDHYYHDETVVARNIQCVREGAAGFPGLEVYAGVEVDMLWAGHLDASYQTLAPFDYIAVACPHWQNNRVAQPVCKTADALAQAQYDMLLSLAELPFVDVVVHPFTFYSADKFMPIEQEALMARYTLTDYDCLIDGLLRNQIAVELHANLKKPDYARSLLPFLQRCISRGVCFSAGSDAHWVDVVGSIKGAQAYIDALHIPDELAFKPCRRSTPSLSAITTA